MKRQQSSLRKWHSNKVSNKRDASECLVLEIHLGDNSDYLQRDTEVT